MTKLPTPLLEVECVEKFSPSTAHHLLSGGCKLRALVRKEAVEPRLGDNPFAARGTFLHNVLEAAHSGRYRDANDQFVFVVWQGSELTTAEWVFDRVLESCDARSGARWGALENTLGKQAWKRYRQDVVSRILGYLEMPEHDHQPQDRRAGPLLAGMAVAEQWLSDAELRMEGRADVVRMVDESTLEIVDHKSSKVFDSERKARSDYATQVRLYALLCLNWPGAGDTAGRRMMGRLEGTDGAVDVECSHDQLEELKSQILEAGDEYLGKRISIHSIAAPGESCSGCPVRHRCQPYLSWAPNQWADHRNLPRIPNDVWGHVSAVGGRGGRLMIDIDCADGRKRRLSQIAQLPIDSPVEIGSEIFVFDFGSKTVAFGPMTAHPVSLYELGETPEERAWPMTLFFGRESA